MRIRLITAAGCSLLALSVAYSARNSPAGVVVAQDGTGDYRTVQSAVDALSAEGGVIRIKPGTYEEKITIDKPGVQLRGLGTDPSNVVLAWHLNAAVAGGTFKSASTTITGDDFYAENLTFQNTYLRPETPGATGTQAVALRVTGDRAVFRRVRFLSHQDTLYATTAGCMDRGENCKPARQYFADCYIEGDVDFIFGDAKAFFDHCEIHSLPRDGSSITAQSKQHAGEKSGYVFDHCRLTADAGVSRIYLGRPWRAYASVVFLNTFMGPQIAPAGWSEWQHGATSSLQTAYYAEYNSQGPGATMDARDPHTVKLNAAEAAQYNVHALLAGDDGWDPTKVR
ncbi:MAG TPA: pectinesterase family protein [Bryobacteraceae bacterium]|nr:pectinesterase family protein [Bryobacteraceae bacterium]